jgi:hypothetical protein
LQKKVAGPMKLRLAKIGAGIGFVKEKSRNISQQYEDTSSISFVEELSINLIISK